LKNLRQGTERILEGNHAVLDMDDLDHTVRALRQRAGAAQTETRIILRST